MSYILDALRRAQAERGRGGVPGLHTPAVAASSAAEVPQSSGGNRLPQVTQRCVVQPRHRLVDERQRCARSEPRRHQHLAPTAGGQHVEVLVQMLLQTKTLHMGRQCLCIPVGMLCGPGLQPVAHRQRVNGV